MRTAAILTQVLALCCLAAAFMTHGASWQTGARMREKIILMHDAPETRTLADMRNEIRSLRWDGIKSLHLQQSASGLTLIGSAVFSAASLILMLASNVRDAGKRGDSGTVD